MTTQDARSTGNDPFGPLRRRRARGLHERRAMDGRRAPALIWTTVKPSRAQLRAVGFFVIGGRRFARVVRRAQAAGTVRHTLANPAARWLALFARHPRLAVLDVPCATVADLQRIHGYLVEPAFRRQCTLLLHTDRAFADMRPDEYADPHWRYPWTVERLRYLTALQEVATSIAALAPIAPVPARLRLPEWLSCLFGAAAGVAGAGARAAPAATAAPAEPPPRPLRLDAQQAAAVRAGAGVVQVIAPAGSGKTSVLIERVKELLHRGATASRILCATFNKDARLEIAARLAREGVSGVEVRSFHGLGWTMLRQEKRMRPRIGALGPDVWRRLAHEAMAAEPEGVLLDPDAAQAAVSTFKLAGMIRPQQAVEHARGQDAAARTAARLYALYEQCLDERRQLDFDDLIATPVALMQDDAALRRRWQDRFDHVLVDEYQDIEPAQALLVGLLAAPQDSLFCVGDEDQCIYAWRRAAVQRVIELDQVYPGLERFPLTRNYRCGAAITAASRRLIEHNRRRFRKPLLAGAQQAGVIRVLPVVDRPAGAELVAASLRSSVRGEVAVLARTTELLREVALACARAGVSCAVPDKISTGATHDPAAVELATIHAAKGREWNRVILYGIDQGQCPHAQSLAAASGRDGIEDERRLFYVALTRARCELDIVCTATRPSQFLFEAKLVRRD
ncbi:MAG: ATP-dependent helicase [Candidatus Krumholzibacteria bacterium]|jgi:hypothetical protein|nr:ATP-dependent helicase [Candidatus Krumholzibacteria bacterium]